MSGHKGVMSESCNIRFVGIGDDRVEFVESMAGGEISGWIWTLEVGGVDIGGEADNVGDIGNVNWDVVTEIGGEDDLVFKSYWIRKG